MGYFLGNKETLFFIYGLAFFTLGVSALQQSTRKDSNFYLLSSLRHLAWFGIAHGLSEWLGIIVISRNHICGEFDYLFWSKIFLNALAFIFLMTFGLSLMGVRKYKGIKINTVPWILFAIWTLGFLSLDYYFEYNIGYTWCTIYCTLSRYFIGLPGGILTGIALLKNARDTESLKLNSIAFKFKLLGFLFISYGIASGVIVSNSIFFPSNLINQQTFQQLFLLPIELVRTIMAVLITIIFIMIVNIFTWEIDEKLNRLLNQQVVNHERRKIGRELHDVLIQKLFSTGMRLENIYEDARDENLKGELFIIKNELNEIITDVRNFIDLGDEEKIEIEDLNLGMRDLVNQFANSHVEVELEYNIPQLSLGQLSQEKLTQIYYIVQEGLSNILKHSKATKATVSLSSNTNEVIVVISDNGIGFNPKKTKALSYGLKSMRERAAIANGCLNVESNKDGTKITVTIPWEGFENE